MIFPVNHITLKTTECQKYLLKSHLSDLEANNKMPTIPSDRPSGRSCAVLDNCVVFQSPRTAQPVMITYETRYSKRSMSQITGHRRRRNRNPFLSRILFIGHRFCIHIHLSVTSTGCCFRLTITDCRVLHFHVAGDIENRAQFKFNVNRFLIAAAVRWWYG